MIYAAVVAAAGAAVLSVTADCASLGNDSFIANQGNFF